MNEPILESFADIPRSPRGTPRYGLLCMARNEWYVKDRLRSNQRRNGVIRGNKQERAFGSVCGLALNGKRFTVREEAEAARRRLQDEDDAYEDTGGTPWYEREGGHL